MREHLLDRIYGEYQAYRADILGLSNTEIFGKSYEIDTVVNIYEILMEKVQELPEDTLAALLPHRNILTQLYEMWLKKDDSSYQELQDHVEDEIEAVISKDNTAVPSSCSKLSGQEKGEKAMENKNKNPFIGCTIVATGKLTNFTREGINRKIISLGASAGSSVTRKTNYIICGEKPGSKLEKARELGVTVLTEQEFLDMIPA